MKTFEQFITESISKNIDFEVPKQYDINVDFGEIKNILNERKMLNYLENAIAREFGDSVVTLPSMFSGIEVKYLRNSREIDIEDDENLSPIAVNFKLTTIKYKSRTDISTSVSNNYLVFYIDYEDGKPILKTDDIATYGTYTTLTFDKSKYKSELMDALEMNNDLTENVLVSIITLAMQLIDDYITK